METTEFIIDSLKNIHAQIKGIMIRYAYDKETNFHIVEVSPESIRRGNMDYIMLESQLIDEFFEKFPEEDLLISEENELLNMSNVVQWFGSETFKVVIFANKSDQEIASLTDKSNVVSDLMDSTDNYILAA